MTIDQKAAEVVAMLRRCVVALDGKHSIQLVNPFEPQSDRNYAFCCRCLLSGDDL